MTQSRILIVEDDIELAERLARPLEAEGFDVAVAGDANTAITSVSKKSPDVIILDLAVRNGEAYRVMNRVRLFPELADTPMVAMSAWDKVREKQRSVKAGVSYFLEKPVESDDLLSVVSAVCARNRGF